MANVSQETMMFKRNREKEPVDQTIREVCAALQEKGYNPKDQLVGYLLSGDPTYITSYKDARNKLRQYERYELVEALLDSYLASIQK
ncbi:MAG: IreB family regulatory phosphoprotein [Acidaminococcaceae bacterium]|nr:IreB family regulatory phosphoprotein [Acidaminococcaceae bacterium]